VMNMTPERLGAYLVALVVVLALLVWFGVI
jgi:hypothetical protein